ncbi:protein Wnt-6 [Brachyhypopomus gauderio]|uniref:protein Wnt-6 n=1 Tax=Brachyhypopomus gauderio TaxID=698409 RepID=UPI00404235E2
MVQARLLLVFALTGPVNIFLLCGRTVAGSPLLLTDPNSICQRAKPPRLYATMCHSQPEIVQEVARGARLGARECQHQFHHQRWNCTSHGRSLGKLLLQDIRETAFVNSITAAGVLYAVTQACSQGELLQCGCVTPRRSPEGPREQGDLPAHQDQRWEWGGCGDDVDFGHDVSRQFVDSRRRKGKSDIRTLTDLHNKEAGRLVVKAHMRTECRCHGLSGSCTLRSCWRKLPLFRHVGDHLMRSFYTAVRVMGSNDGKSLVPLDPDVPPPHTHSLIYSDESPNFCVADRRAGSEGTRGRVCSSMEAGPSCDWLCCDRGLIAHTLVYEQNCQCQFHWCCVVQCQRCTVRKDVGICL